jgi:hypothetical protein
MRKPMQHPDQNLLSTTCGEKQFQEGSTDSSHEKTAEHPQYTRPNRSAVERPGDSFKSKGVLIDNLPERPGDVIDAQKRMAIPGPVASPQGRTLFHQPTPEYSVNNSRSTPANTETTASKNPTAL